jgi:hypothetical protein
VVSGQWSARGPSDSGVRWDHARTEDDERVYEATSVYMKRFELTSVYMKRFELTSVYIKRFEPTSVYMKRFELTSVYMKRFERWDHARTDDERA